MDYKVVSQQVVDNVGGLENIEGATHCVTRLRLVLKDTSKYNKAELENIDGVKGVLYNSGQLMIIFGTGTVNKVYDEFMALTGVKEISASEVKGAEADKKGKFFSVLKVFSDIFIPIIPAFVGAAIIIGLKSLIVANGLFGMEGSLADHSEFLKNLASFFAIIATTFDYLPVLVMYSAVKRFGGNPILGILVGIVMVHPSLMNRNTFVMDPSGAEYWNFGPLSIPMVAFQGGVFPAILTAWFMAKVEKIAQKYIPEVVSFVFVPTVTLILANVALFTVFGPLGNLIGDVLAGVIDILYNRMGRLWCLCLRRVPAAACRYRYASVHPGYRGKPRCHDWLQLHPGHLVGFHHRPGRRRHRHVPHSQEAFQRAQHLHVVLYPDAGRYLRARNLCCKHALLDHPVHLRLHRCRLRRCLREAL